MYRLLGREGEVRERRNLKLTRFRGHCNPYLFKEVSKKMGKVRGAYPKEFKEQIVALHRAGRTPAELAKEFEPTEESIRYWIKQADRDDGLRSDGLTTAEKEELVRLRRENRQLKIEREIL